MFFWPAQRINISVKNSNAGNIQAPHGSPDLRPFPIHNHEEELVIIVVSFFSLESDPDKDLVKVLNNETGLLSAITFYVDTNPPSLYRH